jgi:hypothetical protein
MSDIKTKVCTKCHQEKTLSEFYKNKTRKDGLTNECKMCILRYGFEHKEERKLYCKKYHSEHKKENHQYYIEHRKKILFKSKKRYAENKEEKKLYLKKWYLENKEEKETKRKKHRLENREEFLLKEKQHRLKNKYKIRLANRKYENKKRKTDPIYRMVKNLRGRLKYALKAQGVKKNMHTMELLGCTAGFYQNYIYSLFAPGMTKENNGKRKWQQHHIISFSSVDLSDIEQLKKVCHYTNIIPMWEDEHMKLHSNNATGLVT